MAGTRKKAEKQLGCAQGARSPRPLHPDDVTTQITDVMHPLLDQMASMNEQLVKISEALAGQKIQLAETADKMEKIATKVLETVATNKKVKKRVGKLEKRQDFQENQILFLQMEKSNTILHFQGVPENEKEDLKQLLYELLSSLADIKADTLQSDIDVAYWAHSIFTRKNCLPGEIVVKFSRRSTRDVILKATSATPLKMGDTTIKILKDIPFEICQRRKHYKELTGFLQTNQIIYKWLIPEGVAFKFKEKREKIDSIFKAEEFLKRYLGSAEGSLTENKRKKEDVNTDS